MTSRVIVARGEQWLARSLLAVVVTTAGVWGLATLVFDRVVSVILVPAMFAVGATWRGRGEPALERMGGLLIVRHTGREVRVLPRHVDALSLTRKFGIWFLLGSIPEQGKVRLSFTAGQIRDGAALEGLFGPTR